MADDTQQLARVMERGFDTLADRIRENTEAIRDNGREIDVTSARLDDLIALSGGETRRLREDVDALRDRVEALEAEASRGSSRRARPRARPPGVACCVSPGSTKLPP